MEESACWWCGRDKLPTPTGVGDEFDPVMKHGTVVRSTMYLASLDIRTAFDEAKTKHVADCVAFERDVGVISDGFF